MSFEQMWAELAPIGRSATSGGYFRQPWTVAEGELRSWFAEQAGRRGLRLSVDAVGNQVAWWPVDDAEPIRDAVLTGSHLDSVLDGGAYDGPLGIVSAFAAIDRLRESGFSPSRPIGVAAFVEEEGSRFGVACLGSRLITGGLSPAQAMGLRDRDGVALGDALERAGLGDGAPMTELPGQVGVFVELHVEQGRDLIDRGAPVAVGSGIWPHGRYRFDFTGEANHAGSTAMADRRDPMLSYAMTALAANKRARLSGGRATFGRVDVAPNGTNAVPSRVTGWLDARCATQDELTALVAEIERQAGDRAARDGTTLRVRAESVSPAVHFDDGLAHRLATGHDGVDWPIIRTAAGHDAGVLAQAGVPTAMLFVRNPSGISHAPAEHAEPADCLAGVAALTTTLRRLAG